MEPDLKAFVEKHRRLLDYLKRADETRPDLAGRAEDTNPEGASPAATASTITGGMNEAAIRDAGPEIDVPCETDEDSERLG